jgi:3',5'-cyclic AMP phosphodiesterase CpdA
MRTSKSSMKLVALFCLGLAGCKPDAQPPPTVPVAAAADGVRFIVGGDSRDDSAHVLPWSFREAKARSATAFLFLGDMELTPELAPKFKKELALLDPIPFFPVLGNHEVRQFGAIAIGVGALERKFRERFLGTKQTPVQSTFEDKVVYSIDLAGGVHFVAIDNVSQKGFGEGQLKWLEGDLEAARKRPTTRHILVGMHKPLAKNGVTTHSMDGDGPQAIADSDAALALFGRFSVSLILASHVHELARFSQGGITSYITGGLGAPLKKDAGPEHAFHHFLQLDVKDGDIHVSVIRFDGSPSIEEHDEVD